MPEKTRILMCGSELSVKGGMVSVIKNYLGYRDWGNYDIFYVPTHIEKNKVIVLFYFVISYLKILIFALRKKIDVAYFHTAERGSFFRKAILVRTLKKFGIKTIMHHHAAEFEQFYASLSEKKKKFVNETLELTDLNIVLSNKLISMITDKAPQANVKVLYNAVTTCKFNPYNKTARNILFLGRLGQRKGTYDLLKVISRLNNTIANDIHFYLCGDGDIEGIKEKIKELGIEKRIEYVGWIDGKQKQDIFKKTKFNVLPSYNEGLPMTILETMAYGIPNISTNIASIPEVIKHEENGFLIAPGDLEQLEKYIMLLCEDDDLCSNISQNAWQDINEKFSLMSHIKVLKHYLDDIVLQLN